MKSDAVPVEFVLRANRHCECRIRKEERPVAAQMQLFAEDADRRSSGFGPVPGSAAFDWQWHGRQIFMELRNDFRFPRKLHRIVYHLADACEAPTEAEARAIFQAGYPDAQTTGFFCIGPVKQPKRRKTPNGRAEQRHKENE